METERNVQRMKEQEAKKPKKQLSEEARKIIEAGNQYIEDIRRSNDAIPGVEISNKMYHLENVIRRIFQRVEQHPELSGTAPTQIHGLLSAYHHETVECL